MNLATVKINHKLPVGGASVTEEYNQKFLKSKTFKCFPFNARITKEACDKYQSLAVTANCYHNSQKCKECKRYKKPEKNVEKKACQLHTDFPGYCAGPGEFYKKNGAKLHEFKNKYFCSPTCGNRWNYFKRQGYKKSEDVKGRVTKSFRPEMV